MKTCIYCNRPKEDSEFSQEHILPKSLGGAIHPINPFSTDLVCIRCNTISGLFIDAPFSKSWFLNNYRANNALKFVKLSNSTILPLSYFGVLNELEYENRICEFYLGPTGDLIYHFHLPYPEEIDTPTMVGIPPHIRNREIDYGFAFLFVRSNNPKWHPAIIYSFVDAFKKSQLYLGNGVPPKIEGANFSEIPGHLNALLQRIKSLNGKEHNNSVKIDIDTGARFLAKLALGLGCIFLKDDFKSSSDAELLRSVLWEKNFNKRRNFQIHGTGLLSGNESMKNIDQLLKWEGGHVIHIVESDGSLVLYTNFYAMNGTVIEISKNKQHWEGLSIDGTVYIVIPERQKCVGPILLEDFLAHKFADYKNESLTELESEFNSIEPLPPFVI